MRESERESLFDGIIDRTGTSCFKWDFRRDVFGKEDIIPMWIADMDFMAPQVVIDAFKKRVEHGVYGYTGKCDGFFEAIIEWEKQRHGWEIERKWLATCPGVVSGINTCIQAFTHPGEKIIIQTPVYHPFFDAVVMNGRQLVLNPLKITNHRYEIDYEDLRQKIDKQTKMLIFCSPHNPVGRVWEYEELQKLAEICVENQIILISDEIHQDIVYKGHKHIPIASVDVSGNGMLLPIRDWTVTLTAPSKTFNIAGLLSSVAVIPNEKLRNAFEFRLSANGIGIGNIFGNLGLETAYRYGAPWLDELIDYLDENITFTLDYINSEIPSIKTFRPDGTFLLWLDCEAISKEDGALRRWFIEEAKVGLDCGTVFGPGGEHHMRMNVGCQRETLHRALEQIKKALSDKTDVDFCKFTR
jgi:cystathionine beta-lyase